jgi:transcriptional regulator with XRE-family HTH domain
MPPAFSALGGAVAEVPANRRAASPPTSSSPPMYDFGVLRELRKNAGLTLEAVGERAGVSVAVISKLERNQTSAELETLYRLGRVFGMTGSDLLGLAESRLAHKLQSRSYQSSGFKFRTVAYGNVSAFIAEAPAGARASKPEIHSDEYELCWCLKGEIELALPHGVTVLADGEAVQFDAVQPHTYHALRESRLLILHLRKHNRF